MFSKSILWQPVMHSRVHFSINIINIRNCNIYVQGSHTILFWCNAYNLWTFTWIVHFELNKELNKFISRNSPYFPSILISVLWLYMWYCVLYCNLINLRELHTNGYWKYIEILMKRLITNYSIFSSRTMSILETNLGYLNCFWQFDHGKTEKV